MRTHVTKTVSSCFAVLRQIRSIRRSVTRPVLLSLVVSLVLTRLDYGSATLAGLTSQLQDRLSSVLHAAARLIFARRKYDHVTLLLRELHWLRVPERIAFRLAVLVFRCRHGSAPSYLIAELHNVADVESRQRLRSASTTALLVPRTVRSTFGDRAFPVAAARILEQFIIFCPILTIAASLQKTPQDRTVRTVVQQRIETNLVKLLNRHIHVHIH